MALTPEEQETMAKLGHKTVEMPEGEKEVVAGTEPVQKPETPVTTESTPESTPEETVTTPVTTEEKTDEEQRRSWQSEADKAKAETEVARQELENEKLQKEQLVQMLQGINQSQPQTEPEKQEKKEPQLSDFINSESYDTYDAMNPATVSGQAYLKYQRAVSKYDRQIDFKEFEAQQTEKVRNEVAIKQADILAERYPKEFRNPLDGKPNMQKITSFLTGLSDSDDINLWANWYAFTKGDKTTTSASAAQIGKRANEVQPVASQSASEQETKPVSKTFKEMGEIFGENFEYPVGVEFE